MATIAKRTVPRLAKIHKPQVDDRCVSDALYGLYALPSILVAYKMGLFELLENGGLTSKEIAAKLNLAVRPTDALLACSASLGFVGAKRGRFLLTRSGAVYMLKSSPFYRGPFLDFYIANSAAFSIQTLEKSLRSDSAHGPQGSEWIAMQTEQEHFARNFTHVMHSQGIAAAMGWPNKVNLSRNSVFLDIGGGSGAHAIGALLRWKRLNAIVFDIATVCEVAADYARKYGLQDRIITHSGDMWIDQFPSADVHFYSQIFHDWSPTKCRELTEKSFSSLKPGGRLIVHEMLLNNSKTGPMATAGMSMTMMAWTQGQQFTGSELVAMLSDAGFRSLQVKPAFGYWSIVTGVKP